MLGSIFCYSTQVGFENVVAIEERHFAIRLDPNLRALSLEVKIGAKKQY